MRIYKDISLEDFKAWSGAVDTMDTLYNLQNETGEKVFSIVEDCIDEYGEPIDEVTVNDILWFETDTIAEWLGYEDWEQLERVANGEAEEDKDEDEEDEDNTRGGEQSLPLLYIESF